MKRILAVMMALMLLVSGLALAEEAELAPELEDVAVEAEVEAEADEAPAAEEEDVLLGEGDGVAEANDAVYYMPYTVKRP